MQRIVAKGPIFNKKILKNPTFTGHLSKKSYNILLSIIITVVVILCSLFCVWSHIQVINLGYEISQANTKSKELLQLNKKLKLEIATLTSPNRVEGIAKSKLRLISPKPDQLFIMK
ncbi:MAG: cell division protein FtsL [Thermodesulfobacteriota bacterium]|nr:cell division protein FtsL [Thermodesulfobacteriota bacterium]